MGPLALCLKGQGHLSGASGERLQRPYVAVSYKPSSFDGRPAHLVALDELEQHADELDEFWNAGTELLEEGEEFGFGGLMSSGSFIMSSTGFEEEEELGEGEGFGFGGLMSSGSFIMSSTGFEE